MIIFLFEVVLTAVVNLVSDPKRDAFANNGYFSVRSDSKKVLQ